MRPAQRACNAEEKARIPDAFYFRVSTGTYHRRDGSVIVIQDQDHGDQQPEPKLGWRYPIQMGWYPPPPKSEPQSRCCE